MWSSQQSTTQTVGSSNTRGVSVKLDSQLVSIWSKLGRVFRTVQTLGHCFFRNQSVSRKLIQRWRNDSVSASRHNGSSHASRSVPSLKSPATTNLRLRSVTPRINTAVAATAPRFRRVSPPHYELVCNRLIPHCCGRAATPLTLPDFESCQTLQGQPPGS
jgi:hypothetical protein